MDSISTLITVFIFVFLAELADKTQLLVLFLTLRYKARDTFIGVFLSSGILMAVAVFPAKYLRSLIPLKWIKVGSGIILVIFGIVGLIKKSKENDSEIKIKTYNVVPFVLVLLTFFIAEMGDRTQLAGLSLSLKYKNTVFVWIGAWMGLFLANVPIIFGGHLIMEKVKPKYWQYIGAVLFLVFGTYIIVSALL